MRVLMLFELRAYLFRRNRLYLNRLGWNSRDNRKWFDVFRSDPNGSDHAMFADFHAAHHGCMISNASPWTNFGLVIANDHAIIEIVRMSVNIGIIGDRAALMNNQLATIVEQNVFMNSAIVFDY